MLKIYHLFQAVIALTTYRGRACVPWRHPLGASAKLSPLPVTRFEIPLTDASHAAVEVG
jgi:hypothetical protein